MTTEISVGQAEDAFAKNDLISLDSSAYEGAFALSAADWIAKKTPQDAALSDVLDFLYRALRERMNDYSLWLLLGDTRWQNDTRIVRYRKKFNSLKAQGIDFETLQDRQEFMIEESGKLKFFGAVRLDETSLVLVPETMQPGSCTYLLALPGIQPDLSRSSGWSGRLNEDFKLIQSNVRNDGIIFQRVGYFDDPDVGLVALGRPELIERLVA